MSHAALLPHEVFATLYDKAPDLFRHLMYGTEENLIKFWAGLERTDAELCRNHPVVQHTQPNRRIPIGIHGDDAGTAGRHCVLGIMQLGIVCGVMSRSVHECWDFGVCWRPAAGSRQ